METTMIFSDEELRQIQFRLMRLERLEMAVRTHKELVLKASDPNAPISRDAADRALWLIEENLTNRCQGDCCG